MFDDPILGEIRMFGGNFAPRGWALCNGGLLPIVQNTALFSLLGTNFGGDGKSTFGLPNLQGMAPMNAGNGPGLSPRSIGETGGTPTVTLTVAQLAAHTHPYNGENAGPTSNSPTGYPAAQRNYNTYTTASGATTTGMSAAAIGGTGGNQPHNNMQPYLAVTFIIALQGVYPQRP